jgi:hypothetical protein
VLGVSNMHSHDPDPRPHASPRANAVVPQGSARVIRCLQSQRAGLSPTCRATLFDSEVTFSENIDFQYPMKQACSKEIGLFCAKVPHGNARVIRWVPLAGGGGTVSV